MTFVRVRADDRARVEQLTALSEAARLVDDPDSPPNLAELTAAWLEVGWDMEPGESYLFIPSGADAPVGWFELDMSERDNVHLVVASVVVHPEHRRRGHGTAMMAEVLRRTREAGRSTIWVAAPEDDVGAHAFLANFGFRYASHDARRRQVWADLDWSELDRLHASARKAAIDYEVERLVPPLSDDVLADLVTVTAAINDAPMGDLTHEDETFDVARLRDMESALRRRGDRAYRVVARHRRTGEVAGHTVLGVNPRLPTFAGQGDTAVARNHRGHRLGLLLKLEMMRWLAEVEPQIEVVETWNHADNTFMVRVNELIGYRLSRVFAMDELTLDSATTSTGQQSAADASV